MELPMKACCWPEDRMLARVSTILFNFSVHAAMYIRNPNPPQLSRDHLEGSLFLQMECHLVNKVTVTRNVRFFFVVREYHGLKERQKLSSLGNNVK